LTVTDLGNTTAAALNIAGTATGTTIDGAEEKTITVTNTDTLSSLQTKINQAGFAVKASIINDGSPSSPYRLSLTANNSGEAGRVVIDGGTTNLNFTNLVDAQDAAVFFGGTGSSQPLLITSSSNTLTNVINGVTVNLVGAGSSPVTLNVSPDSSNVTSQLAEFTNDFNTLVTTINAESNYNTTSNQGGILLGDATTQQIQQTLYNLIGTVLPSGKFTDLADVGITIQANASVTGATLQFNTNTFEAAFASDPSAVQGLFAQGTNGFGTVISNAIKTLTDPVSGVVTLQDNSLSTSITQYQAQITELNAVLADKREQLQTEFNYMEQTLATLQSQQSVLSAFNSASASASAAINSATSSIGNTSSDSSSSSSDSSSSGS
jgi:flagellar hook-associated protein 2